MYVAYLECSRDNKSQIYDFQSKKYEQKYMKIEN